jgi:hypothetical protein
MTESHNIDSVRDIKSGIPLSNHKSDDSTLSFDVFLDKVKENDFVSRYLKLGSQEYSVRHFELDLQMDTTNDSIKPSNVASADEAISQRNDSQDQNTDLENSQKKNEPVGVHSGLMIYLSPIDATSFIAQLPESLRSFIHEIIQVYKVRNNGEEAMEYRFKFDTLKLEVVIRNDDKKMVIELKVDDQELSKRLFTHENKLTLASILVKELSKESVDIVFVSEDGGNGSSSSHSQSGHDQKESDSSDSEEDN